MVSLYGEGAVLEEEVAEADVVLVVVYVLHVGYLHHPRRLAQLSVVEGLVHVRRHQQSLSLLGVVAHEVGHHEVAQDGHQHDSVGGHRGAHPGHCQHQDDEEGDDVEVDPEHAVGGLAVVVEPAVGTQKLAVPGRVAVVLVGKGYIAYGLAPDEVEEILTAMLVVPVYRPVVVNGVVVLLRNVVSERVPRPLVRLVTWLHCLTGTLKKSKVRSMKQKKPWMRDPPTTEPQWYSSRCLARSKNEGSPSLEQYQQTAWLPAMKLSRQEDGYMTILSEKLPRSAGSAAARTEMNWRNPKPRGKAVEG